MIYIKYPSSLLGEIVPNMFYTTPVYRLYAYKL